MADETPVVSFADKPMQALSMDESRKPVPAYTVTPMSRTTIVNKAIKDEIGFRVVPTEIVVEGYMVRTLRGDSVFLKHDDLVRMKLDRNLVPLLLEGGDDTPVGMQQVNSALSDKQRTALEAVTQMIERNPALVEQLLAAGAQADEEAQDNRKAKR